MFRRIRDSSSVNSPRHVELKPILVAVVVVTAMLAVVVHLNLAQSVSGIALVMQAVVLAILIYLGLCLRTRAARFRAAALFLGLACCLALGEAFGYWYFQNNPLRALQREVLLTTDFNNQTDDSFFEAYSLRALPQPYLFYVPAPNYRVGANYHNQQGYRGQPVPMRRTDGIARVLCMGGSTTYGTKVADPLDAYPAQLEQWLEDNLPAGVREVEVINAGLPNGTTAEILTHYQFKFQYFEPDLVIINTGGNDAYHADSKYAPYYQPDYSHRRKAFSSPRSFTKTTQFLCRSRFLSVIVLKLLSVEPTLNSIMESSELHKPPPTVWHPAAKEAGAIDELSDDELAYTRNLRRLIQMIKSDGAELLLVPFRIAPGSEEGESVKQCHRNETIMQRFAAEHDVAFAPFPADVIVEGEWIDSCHLNSVGCREKARYIGPFAVEMLRQRQERASQRTFDRPGG